MSALESLDARTLTDRIKVAVEGAWQLIIEAYQSRAWATLGYTSWDEYCTREFGQSRLRLPREDRREQIASMRESGLSLRAIESATGVSRPTIIKDLREPQVVNSLPPTDDSPAAPEPALTDAPGRITKLTGSNSASDSYWSPEEKFVGAHPITGEVIETPTTVTETHTIKTVTGLDGKAYPKAAPKPKAAPVATGDAANRQNAEAASVAIGRGLSTFEAFTNANYRRHILTEWWPLGKDSVPPANRDLFNPSQLRQIAQGINQLANELEALK